MTIAFIEEKTPNLRRVEALLTKSSSANRWANRGPVYEELARALAEYATAGASVEMVPLSNGGVALEVMARFLSMRAGRRQRWVASAFSFRNIGRGYFHDVLLLDCQDDGLLDLAACSGLDPDSFDGLIVTNPFGIHRDFTKYAEFARRHGKAMLIDNAAGFHTNLPDWPWQAFSFHHTKPYGVGEGGAALVPRQHAEAVYALLDYASDHAGSPHWQGNGKISDLSCAFILERLEKADDWVPRYLEQRYRVASLAEQAGFSLLAAPQDGIPMTSLPLLAPDVVPDERIHGARHMTLGKYYKPLRSLPVTSELFAHLVNVPCHPDLSRLEDAQILEELDRISNKPEVYQGELATSRVVRSSRLS